MTVAPGDVAADQSGLGRVVGVVGAGDAEVAERLELWLDPVQPGGVEGRVGELDVVGVRPGAHLLAQVRAEVVEHEVEPRGGRIERAEVAAEGEELDPALAPLDVPVEAVAAEVVGGEEVADAVWAGVGRPDPARLRSRRPRLPARLRLQVERPKLVQTDHDRRAASASAYSSRIRFFLASKWGSF